MVGEDVKHLLSARRKISSSIATLSRLHSSLSSSHSRLQNILRRLSTDLPSPPPLHPSAAPELTSLIDAALHSFSPLLLSFQFIHKLQPSLLFDDPQSFLSHYLDNVCCLERHLDLLSQYYSPALDRFQNVVDFLNHTHYLDEHRLRKLTHALVDARNSQPDAGLSRIDGGLLDQALTKLQEEFGRLLVLHSSPIDLSLYSSSESDVPISTPQLPLSSDLVLKLLVISDRLRVNGRTHKCLQVYREVRARAVRKSIQSLSPVYLQYSTPDAVSRLSWSETEQYLSYWVQHVKVIVTVLFPAERELCGRVFKTVDVSRWLKCFGEIVEQSSFPLFFRFGEAVALSKNPPERLLLPLLNLFDTLENMRQDASNVFENESCLQTWTRFKEFQKQLVHNVCRVFWEFGKRAETQQTVQLPPNGGNDKVVVSYVVNYMIMLVGDYGYLMEEVLRIQQSWKEVGSMQQTNLSLATLRILNSLGKNLDDRARKYSDPTLGHVFLMNNYWYMLTRAKSSELGPCVGEGWLKECKSRVDQSALKYKKEGWERVLVHLSKDGLPVTMSNGRGSGVREFVKARIMAFNEAFEETYYKHCQWSISDVQLREDVKNSVVQLIVPAYHNFVQNYGSVLQGAGGAQRVIKYSANMLEHLLGDLFQDKPGRQLNSISSSETRSSNLFS